MDPDPAPTRSLAKKTAAPGPSALKRNLCLPSARTLAHFLAEAQAAVRLKGEVTVLLTSGASIRRLNRQFRGKDKATDVLSFPADGIGAEEIAGDLAISVPTALKQAIEQGHPLATEIKVLILHGLLHLAGYDHEADKGKMARREGQLRAKLGLPHGLIERVAAQTQGKPGSGAEAHTNRQQAFRGLKAPAPSDKDRVPQVRDPRGQVLVRGVEIRRLGPGKPRTQTPSKGQKP
jgi:probable rRNA maturation factor